MFDLIFNGFFKHPNQNNPCYRKVLSYTFFRYQKNNTSDKVLRALRELKSKFDKEEPYALNGYIGLYPIQFPKKEKGYLVIEATRQVYPLVSYGQSVSVNNSIPNKTRYAALKVAINDIFRVRDKIIKIFDKYQRWNSALESELEKLFKYKNNNF